MATNIGTAFFNVTFNTAAARREVTALVSNVNRQFSLLGGVALVGATAAIAGLIRATLEIGKAALTASIEYEQAFASVRKTVDDGTLSAAQAAVTFGRLNEDLRGLALEVPLDLEEDIANVAALGGQLGIPAENLKEFTRIVGELGVTTNVAVEDAATSFARLANIMGLGEKDFRDLGDTVVNLGNKLPAQEDEILRFANRIAAAGEIAGFSADEVLAVGAAMASVGVPSERGGTAIQRTWIKITDAVANGGEILDLVAKVSGETSEEFAQHWETDAAGAWTEFVEGLGRTGTDAFKILRDLGLNDQRVIQSLLSISNAGTLMRETFAFAADDAGALATESEIFFNTTAGQMQLFQNRLHDVSITIGDEMKPAFRDILFTINDWIAENPELIEQLGVELRGALEKVGGIIERILPVAEDLLDLLPDLVSETAAWAGPLVDVAGAILEVGNAFITLRGQVREGAEAGNFLDQLTDTLMTGAVQGLPKTLETFQNAFDVFSVTAPDPSEWNVFWRAVFPPTAIAGVALEGFRAIGDEAGGLISLAQSSVMDRLAEGTSTPFIVAFEELVSLHDELTAIDPDAVIPSGFFGGIIEEAKLTKEQVFDLFHLLRMEGVQVPSLGALLDPTIARRAGPRGGGGAAKTPAQQNLEDWEDANEAADAAAANMELKAAVVADLQEKAEALGVSVSTVLANWERLAPAAAGVLGEGLGEGLGEAVVQAELFAGSLKNLKEVLDFRPASAGRFGVGDIIEGIDLVMKTLKGAKGEADREVRATAQDFQAGVKKNLDQIARFEANLTILFARGQETLARQLAEQGPAAGAIAAGFVSNFGDAAETEANLVGGGVIPDALADKLSEALGGKPVPPGLLDFVASLGSKQVQDSVFQKGYTDGLQFGTGFKNGLLAAIGELSAFLGLVIPGAGRTPPSGIIDRGALTPAPPPGGGGGTGAVGITSTGGTVVVQNFALEAQATPQTQQAMQQAAAVIRYTG
jgi:TP901 family phage tail tape measure protein